MEWTSFDTWIVVTGMLSAMSCALLGNYVAEFAQGAFEAEVDVPTEPVQSSFGWHVILVTERTDPDVDLDLVRELGALLQRPSEPGNSPRFEPPT